MSWFIKKSNTPIKKEPSQVRIPEGLWEKCPQCGEIIYRQELTKLRRVCPKCGYHFRISPKDRLEQTFDDGAFELLYNDVQPADPLNFKAAKRYKDQIKGMEKRGMNEEAVWVGRGKMDGQETLIAIMDFGFLGGSMGSVVGEKITRAVECCIEEKLPLVVFSCSGGARMMEGAISLMQMAKISAALGRLSEQGVPFISVLTDPTTGGVTASYAMLGDLNVSEPGALICFAGPRVIQQTIKQDLPEGFQRAEFLLEHGMLDAVVPRDEMKNKLARFIKYFTMNR